MNRFEGNRDSDWLPLFRFQLGQEIPRRMWSITKYPHHSANGAGL